MIYLLDTNAWSDAFRGVGVVSRKLSSVAMSRVLLAAPVLYELRRGAASAPNRKAWKQATDTIAAHYAIAPLDGAAAENAAQIAATLKARGRHVHHLDTLIAGIAVATGATLITRDTDFTAIAGLSVESWA